MRLDRDCNSDGMKIDDAYQFCVEGLIALGSAMVCRAAWREPSRHRYGIIFDFTGPVCGIANRCGCITEVKYGYRCGDYEIGLDIINDPDIPTSDEYGNITIPPRRSVLEKFASYQRRLDKALVRPEPVWYYGTERWIRMRNEDNYDGA
jgi:hypothetical protein